jgi:NAD-dependent SIR2 family protein deacetylase
MNTLQCPNCGAVYHSSAHPDDLRDPHCKHCQVRVVLVEPQLPDKDLWDTQHLMKWWEGERCFLKRLPTL